METSANGMSSDLKSDGFDRLYRFESCRFRHLKSFGVMAAQEPLTLLVQVRILEGLPFKRYNL